ncbi:MULTISPECIES: hypothetical protein [Halococcus]|uniref:Sterol desaturase family protein n=1 Tax=Halococcus salifodinae DSM 8989 TaxID=1227456 RepID=M0NB73_9EURY|nr:MULTISPECIES: hypothetical protein [Halococcus]EMA55096.1 sterol desaturase family protein [Halococcus salifodinae DSM 8989]
MNRFRAWVLAAVVGIGVGGGTFAWLVSDLTLAFTLALVYTVGTRLLVEYGSTMPGLIYGDDWQAVRWNGAATAFVMIAAFVGVSASLPVSGGLRLALELLVLGVGWTGLFFGIAMARDQAATGKLVGETEPPNGSEREGAAGTAGENA